MILGLDPNGRRKSKSWEPEAGASQDHRFWPNKRRAVEHVVRAMEGLSWGFYHREEENENKTGVQEQ